MATKPTDPYTTEAQLARGKDFKAFAVSYFDGMLDHHRALLSHGKAMCEGNPDDLLVILCTHHREEAPPPGTAPSILSPGERLRMLHHMGYGHIFPCTVPDIHIAGRLFKKAKRMIPGADVWQDKAFQELLDGLPGVARDDRVDTPPEAGPDATHGKQMGAGLDATHGKQTGAGLDATHGKQTGAGPDAPHQPQPRVDQRLRQKPTNQHHEIISLIEDGHVEAAAKTLGYAFPLEGLVVEGNRIGRTLGYPTANLRVADRHKVLPGQGVYVALVKSGDTWYHSMANIGIRPTLDMEHVTIEAHLFDFDKDIYGEWITIAFLGRIRDEMRFNSLSQLKMQLQQDSIKAKKLLDRLAPANTTANFVFTGHPDG